MRIAIKSLIVDRWVTHKKRYRMIIFILFSVIVSLCIGSPKTHTTVFSALKKYSCYSSYSISQMDMQGYSYDSGSFVALHSDPGFTSGSIDQFLYDVSLALNAPLPQDTLVDFFYANDDEEFSSKTEIIVRAAKGDTEIMVPVNQYVARFRLDIGNGKDQIIPEFKLYFNRPNLLKEIFNFSKNLLIILLVPLLIYKVLPIFEEKLAKKNGLLKCMVAMIIIFLILVCVKVNDSNMMVYHDIFSNNVASVDPVVLGTPRPVRSDEWGCALTADLYRIQQDNKGINSFIDALIFCIDPQNWGYLFLPIDMGLSWARMLPYFLSFIAIFYFFHIFMKESILYPFLAAFILIWAPEIAWWNLLKIYMHFFLVFDLFYLFCHSRFKRTKVLCCIGLLISAGTIIVTVYPAWHILLAYLGVFLLIGLFLQEGKISVKKTDIIYILVTAICLLGFALCYFISQRDFIAGVADTVYPGKRQSMGGGLSFRYFAHYLLAPILPFREIPFSNNSEASSFISFFPVPIVVYCCQRNKLKRYKVLHTIFIFICICAIYMVIGFPLAISKLTLWSYSTTTRAYTIFGLSCLILLILEAYYLQKETSPEPIKNVLENRYVNCLLVILLFFYYIFMRQKEIVEYLGAPLFCILAIGVMIVGYVSLKGKIKILLTVLTVVTIFSGITVNPIVFGTDIIFETPIAEKIRAIDEQEPGNWITVDNDIWKAKYLRAQGVECLNALSYPPRLDLFSPLDPNGEDVDIYNRYAHVGIDLCNDESSFHLVQLDFIQVNLNIDDMEKWNVNYVLSANQLDLDTNVLYSELIYTDGLDGNYIYRIHYE